jgi:hypothetical protein
MKIRIVLTAGLLLWACRPAPAQQIRAQSLVYPGTYRTLDIRELRLVHPHARQSNRGRLLAAIALRAGRHGYPNRKFLRSNPRLACAAFLSWCLRQTKFGYTSNSASQLYRNLLHHGGKLVAEHMNTRYIPYLVYYKPGDCLFFWKGRRIGHTEVYVGGGSTVGTSSSSLHIGIRKLGNRGFSTVSVIRL